MNLIDAGEGENTQMFRKGDQVKIARTRSKRIRPGTRGEVKWTWPKGHPYHGKYFQVAVGKRKPRRHILAASVLTRVA